MNHYMLNITLPARLTEEFVLLIPQQRAFVSEKMRDGIITGYSLAKDRSRLGTTIAAESKEDVMAVANEFPLRKYFRVEVVELLFHDHVGVILPQMSLN